jgi:hypothetical protein
MGGRNMRLSPCSGAAEAACSQFNMTFGAGVASRAWGHSVVHGAFGWRRGRGAFQSHPPESACSGRTARQPLASARSCNWGLTHLFG